MANYEYKRTCARCGHVRYVPADLAEAKPRKQAKMVGWATPLVGKKRQTVRAEQALVDAHNQQLTDSQRCANCGSASYSEERVSV